MGNNFWYSGYVFRKLRDSPVKSLRSQSLYNGHSPEEEFRRDVAVLTGQLPGGLDRSVVSTYAISRRGGGGGRDSVGYDSGPGLLVKTK